MSEDAEAAIRRCEDRRGQALVKADYAALADLMTDDLVHIHMNGAVESRQAYIDGIKAKLEFLSVTRKDVAIRIYGDIAVATGGLEQSARVKGPGVIVDVKAMVTQVWRLDAGQWRICSFQATKTE